MQYRIFPLKREVHIYGDEVEMKKLYIYTKLEREATPIIDGQLIGVATPDELGRLIFKVVKTNDRKLYKALIHPHPIKILFQKLKRILTC